MPRQLATRVLRALLAVWFVLTVGEPSVLRTCPKHASAAAELAEAGFDSLAPSHPSAHAAHAAGDHHGAHGARTNAPAPSHHQHHCTCINCCVGAASAALAAPHVQLAPAQVVAVAAHRPSWRDVPAFQEPPHLLPPGTGPPRA
jgi:hypothetical protein